MPRALNAEGSARPLLLTTDAVGGVWRYSVDLARGLSDCGVAVVLAVLGPAARAEQRAEAEAVPGLHLVQTGLPLDWTAPDAAALAQVSERLCALAALTGAYGVHLHAPALVGAVRWPVPVVAVAHSCMGTWWRAVRDGPWPEDFEWRIAATRTGLHAAAAVIAPTAAHAAAVRDVYGSLPVAVVHNGSDLPVGQPTAGRGILTAGRLWDEGKGGAVIDAAAAQLGTPIRAAGPVQGPNGAAVDLPHLHHLGVLDSAGMAQAYAESSVFVSMARYEPFGLSVLEAARAGLRLVLSDIPSFRELWDGVATFVEPADLSTVLRAALDTPGDGGAQDRAARYTVDRTVNGTRHVHAQLGARV